ncbi:MAG: HAD family hydrolase [Thermosulfidibacteraceae bacterium]
MFKVRAVVFDLYGTLVDIQTNEWKPEIFDFISKFLGYYGMNMSPEEIRVRLDLEIDRAKKLSKEVYPEIDLLDVFEKALFKEKVVARSFVEAIVKIHRIISIDWIRLFPDTLEVLRELKKRGFKMGILSDAQGVFTYSEIRMLGLDVFFDYILFSTEFGFKKPDPRLFRMVATILDTPPEDTLYVGDSVKRDLVGAKAIGMKMALVRSSLPSDFPVKPDLMSPDLKGILSFLD